MGGHHSYLIRPHGSVWILSGSRLPYPLRHTRLDFALEHAQWLLRDVERGSVWVLDSAGYPVACETVCGVVPRLLGG